VLSAAANLTAGANVTLVAHLTAAGEPTATPFVNDVSPVAAEQARVVVPTPLPPRRWTSWAVVPRWWRT
jgi:hypothetical protein